MKKRKWITYHVRKLFNWEETIYLKKYGIVLSTIIIEMFQRIYMIKFIFSEKATKIDKIFTGDLTLTT